MQCFDSDLLDKDFQCTSATILYLPKLFEKDDIENLKYHLFKIVHYNIDDGVELNELSSDRLSEEYTFKFDVPVSPKGLLKDIASSKQLVDFDRIDKDFQCIFATARYLSDLLEIDPSIIILHGLYDNNLYSYDIDELKILYYFSNRMS